MPYADLSNLSEDIREALHNQKAFLSQQGIHYRGNDYLVLEGSVSNISGIWDLPMLGAEALDVEHMYQMETDGPEVTLIDLEGAFVERGAIVCQLQDDCENNEYCSGSKASGERLEENIRLENIHSEKAADLRARHVAARKKFLEERRTRGRDSYFYQAGALPKDAVYVVRTSAIRAFEQTVLQQSSANKPMSQREETTLLNITGGLLGLLLGQTPAGKPQSVYKTQSSIIDALLTAHEGKPGISLRTLQEKFALAKKSLET